MPESSAKSDPIKHVVLLMMENHSFDQMLGAFKAKYPTLEGVDPKAPPRTNTDEAGKVYQQLPTTERRMLVDPMHEVEHVSKQLSNNNGGFVLDLQSSYAFSKVSLDQQKKWVMGYYPRGFLPALHALAEDFTICDHWFSSVPGPTWTNRLFALSASSAGIVMMPGSDYENPALFFQQDQDTIFDALNDRGITWKVYAHDFPLSLVLTHQRQPKNLARYASIDQFEQDVQGPADRFPQFSFIEPCYASADENDDHPPHDVMRAQALIAKVYNALRSRQDLWNQTLLVVLYDEHGGFYDHVPPPEAPAPDDKTANFAFNRLGVRVPALLVSPWVERAFVPTRFDHTSFLRYLAEKWDLRMLSKRMEWTNSIAGAIRSAGKPRVDTKDFIKLTGDQLNPPPSDFDESVAEYFSQHHSALALFAREVGNELDLGLPTTLPSIGHWLSAGASAFDKLLHKG